MKTITTTFFFGLVLLACGVAEAASPEAIDCAARAARINIKPVAQQELDIGGGKFSYGFFSLTNKSGKPVHVFADVRGQKKYLMVHPNSASLQRQEGNSWVDDFISLSEYSGPSKKVAISENEEWQFIYPLADLVINKVSRTQQYRLVLRDVDLCSIASEPFTLESLSQKNK